MKYVLPPSRHLFCALGTVLLLLSLALPANAQRQMERLGRGVVVLHSATSQAYVSWRLLATDPGDVGFNVYRSTGGGAGVKLNSLPLTNTTDYVDASANFSVSNAWYVVPVTNGVAGAPSAAYGLPANSPVRQYIPIPLVAPGVYTPYDVKFCWVGDFDGDGEYDFLVDRLSTTGGVNQFLQAYKRDGTFLWQMDMGPLSTNTSNAYEPDAAAISVGDKDNVTVYDLDGDGRAEVIVRVADGTILPSGATIVTNNNTSQFLCILDGLTGAEKARALIPNPYFADGPLNCHAGIAYFDGIHPSILFSGENRVGSAQFQRLSIAWDFRDGKLTQRWLYQTPPGQNDSEGHQLRIADVNHDGKDELIRIGGVVADSNGVPVTLYSTELAHGDRYHVTDIDPDRPGLEMFAIQQLNQTLLATALQDLGSGQLFKKWYSAGITDVGRGVTLDMVPSSRGAEVFSTQPGIFDAKGNQLYANNVWAPEAIWWDADLGREFEDGAGSGALSPVINKFNPATGVTDRKYTLYNEDGGCHQAYGGRAAFWGDILGDWREEFIVVANDYNSIRIYTTKIQATNRLYCLMQNPQYRVQCTFKGYYQASYVDYFLGNEMPPPPPAPVSDARLVWRGNGVNTWNTSAANWFTNNLWISNTVPTTFNSGDTVLFDMTGSNTTVALNGALTPGWVTVHSPKDYTFDGSNGSLTGTMKLTKAGAGKLVLTGTNNYTGATLVGEGALIVNGALSNSPVTVRGGVWLDGRLGGNGIVVSPVSLNEGAGVSPGQGTNSPGTLTIAGNVTMTGRTRNDFDLSDDPTGAVKTNDLLVITGNLTLQGTNTFLINRLNDSLPAGSVYPLITYSGTLSGSLNNLMVLGLTGIPVALTNPPGQIALVVKSFRPPASITWTGGSGGNVWDLLTTSNWLNGAAKDVFAPGDTVRFDNSGLANPTVTLSGDLNCAGVVVDSTGDYAFTGSGGIIGSASLTKLNSGTLTISAANNSYTGKTILSGGMLVVSELDAVGYPSPIGNPPGGSTNFVLSGNPTLRVTSECYTDRGMTLNAGTNSIEVLNANDQFTMAGVIAGTGALQKIGAGSLALNVNNAYTGPTFIRGGNLSLGGGTANQYGLGPGPGGNGNTTVTLDHGTLTMFSDAGSYDNVYWNVVVPANSTGTIYADDRVNMRGTLTGGGTLNFNVYYVRTELDGNWSAFTGQLNVGTDSGGGDFRIGNTYGYANASVNLADHISAYHISGSAVSLGAVSGGPLAWMGGTPWTVGAKNTDATFAGTIGGNSITKVGTGIWRLTGNNTYTGTTTISGGTLLVNGDDSAATGAVTVNSGGTFGGIGIVGGLTTVNGTLAPGDGGIGTLSFTTNVTLASGSTTAIELNKTSGTSDVIDSAGKITYGGTLTVNNLAGTIAPGDSFKIFNAATYSGSFSAISLPPLVNAVWVTTNLAADGTISVVAGGGPVTSLTWRGDGAGNVWDVNLTANWTAQNGAQTVFSNGLPTLFNDIGSNNSPVIIAANVQPGTLTINASRDYVFSGGGSIDGTNSLVKTGGGMLTLMNSNNYSGGTIVSNGTLRTLGLGRGLAHRWSFNNSLADSAGASTATLVDVGANNATLDANSVTLAGGSRTTSDYINLGAGLLPNTTSPVTIELWATQNAVQNWSRIFDFGASTAENLFMSWSQGTTLASDRVEWKDASTSNADNTCQPYTLGTEFHIAMVIEPGAGANGTTRVTWYRAASTNDMLGAARGTFDCTNTLVSFANNNCWLGRSEYTGDNTASASYNEVRIWSRALSAADLQVLHANGPDAGFNPSLPVDTALSLASATAKFENQSGAAQSIGSLTGVAGSEVKLTTSGLVVGSDDFPTTFAGFFSGTNGFTKTGAGALTLSGASTATGVCVVSNGTLFVNGSLANATINVDGGTLGGNGTLAGATTIRPGATLSPGIDSIDTLTFGSSLTLQAGSTSIVEISRSPLTNDLVNISGALINGGTLVVTNVSATPFLAGDQFKLYAAGSYGGSFDSVTLPVLASGLGWDTSLLNSLGRISVISVVPQISAVSIGGGNFILSGSGGLPDGTYYVLTSTNLALPLANWTRIGTNTYDVNGNFSFTNAMPPGSPQHFYLLQLP